MKSDLSVGRPIAAYDHEGTVGIQRLVRLDNVWPSADEHKVRLDNVWPSADEHKVRLGEVRPLASGPGSDWCT
jgi:hypothetical protein